MLCARVTGDTSECLCCLRQAWSQQLNQQSAKARLGAESWLTNFQANSKNMKLPKWGMPVNVEVDVLRPLAATVREAVAGTYLSLPLPVQVRRPAHCGSLCAVCYPERAHKQFNSEVLLLPVVVSFSPVLVTGDALTLSAAGRPPVLCRGRQQCACSPQTEPGKAQG